MQALDKIAQDQPTPATYMDQAKKDLADATDFVREKHLVTLPAGGNLEVIPTPESSCAASTRWLDSIAAPALEPQLGAFYWVTPIPHGLAEEPHRIEAARIQPLRHDGDHHP